MDTNVHGRAVGLFARDLVQVNHPLFTVASNHFADVVLVMTAHDLHEKKNVKN
jgi:hypothetical protein